MILVQWEHDRPIIKSCPQIRGGQMVGGSRGMHVGHDQSKISAIITHTSGYNL